MLQQHAKLIAWAKYYTDLFVTVVAFHVAYWFRDKYLSGAELKKLQPIVQYYPLLIIILFVWTIVFSFLKAYKTFRTIPIFEEIITIIKAVLISIVIVAALAFGSKSYELSRSFIFTFVVFNIVLLSIERNLIRYFQHQAYRSGRSSRHVVIVGTDEAALFLAQRIESYAHWGFEVIGFVSENRRCPGAEKFKGSRYPFLGCITDLETIMQHHVIDEVIFSGAGMQVDSFEDIFLMLEEHGINARIVANMFPHLIAKVSVEEIDGIPLLTFSTVPSNVYKLMTKRVADVVISFFMLVLLSPVMLLAALAIKLTSPGPVLFRQMRSGLNGRLFTLYKFRSMYIDAEARKKELASLNEMDGPVFKIKNDPRIMPVGKFLRKSSIDELPQLWNVLIGDMSLVGPRPLPEEEARNCIRWQRRRLSMRPGITCIWQVSGRNRITDFNEWVRLDLHYIDTWSLALDAKILLKTVPVVLFRKGAA